MSLRKRAPAAVLAVWLLLGACAEGGAGPDESAVIRRDSAGILIVEAAGPLWRQGDAWTVDAEPELVIGQVAGEAEYLFGEVRGAVRLDHGSVVVIDNQARELRWFDRSGAFVRAVGRPGGGPAEFPSSAWQLQRCGRDRLYAHDLWGRRIVVWDTTGVFQRSFELVEPSRPGRGPYNHTCRPDGGFVAIGWGYDQIAPPAIPEGKEAVTYRQQSAVWALDSLGALERDLGNFLSSERIGHRNGSGPHPFGRAAKFAADPDRIFLGSGEGLAVGVYRIGASDSAAQVADAAANARAASGQEASEAAGAAATVPAAVPDEIWRARATGLAIDDALLAAYAAADTSVVRDQRSRRWVLEGEVELPPELPGYTELRVSPDGHLWTKRFVPPWERVERWGVFAPDGVFLGDVEFPANLWVTDIGDEYVVGVAKDELDVERVQVHRIRR
jgi:hypothetical protein